MESRKCSGKLDCKATKSREQPREPHEVEAVFTVWANAKPLIIADWLTFKKRKREPFGSFGERAKPDKSERWSQKKWNS